MQSVAANVGVYIKLGPFGWRFSSWAIVVGVTGRRAESCVRFAAALLMFPSHAGRNTWSLHHSSNCSCKLIFLAVGDLSGCFYT